MIKLKWRPCWRAVTSSLSSAVTLRLCPSAGVRHKHIRQKTRRLSFFKLKHYRQGKVMGLIRLFWSWMPIGQQRTLSTGSVEHNTPPIENMFHRCVHAKNCIFFLKEDMRPCVRFFFMVSEMIWNTIDVRLNFSDWKHSSFTFIACFVYALKVTKVSIKKRSYKCPVLTWPSTHWHF